MIKQLIEENEIDIKSIKRQIKLKVQFHSQLRKGWNLCKTSHYDIVT